MTRLRKVTGSGAVVVCVFVMGTGVLAQLKPRHNSSAVDVAVKDLQSDLPDLREGAEVRLYALGPDDHFVRRSGKAESQVG
jgi:hypothetical protein